MPAHRSYTFGEFTLDLTRGAMLKAGTDVRLRPKSFEVLRVLVERHGELVTKDELLDAVWGRVVVSEGSLTQCIIDVRRALGDDEQRIVRTVLRRGYLFDAPDVQSSTDEAPAPASLSTAEAVPPGSRTVEPIVFTPAEPASPRAADAVARRPSHRWRAAVAAIVLVALVGFASWWAVARRGDVEANSPVVARRASPNSVAVLPFVNMSPEPDQEYFSDGISEEILNLLSQSRELRVIARTSSFSFKGQAASVADIGAKLNVAYVLEGSVRKSGSRLRITAQLVDVASSAHVWSMTYNREVQDAFALQSEIAARVATALKATLAAHRPPPGDAPSASAYDLYLRAKYFYNRRGPGDVELARKYFEEAVRVDPNYAPAWTGLAGVYEVLVSVDEMPADTGLEKRRDAIEKALSNDPNLAEAHLRAAKQYWETGDGRRAADHAAKAYALDPGDPYVLSNFCTLLAWQGRVDDALKLERELVADDPFSIQARLNYANVLMAAGQLEDAKAQLLRAVELSPEWQAPVDVELTRILLVQKRYAEALEHLIEWPSGLDQDTGLAIAHRAIGNGAEADAAIARLAAGTGPGSAVRLSEVYAQSGDPDEAFHWMARAYERLGPNAWLSPQWHWLYPLRFSPLLTPLHEDPRWAHIRMRGMPPGAEAVLAVLPKQFEPEVKDGTGRTAATPWLKHGR